jgi:hypothetical protein
MRIRFLCQLLFTLYPVFTFAQRLTPVFKPVPNNEMGINFANVVKESSGLNIITYEYFYNGGGVGLGDFNNDGLIDIYFTGNVQPAQLLLNKGNFKFEDITSKAGVKGKKGWKTGCKHCRCKW